MEDYVKTANINIKWLDNIYENIKNIENCERRARLGCRDLLEYVSIPFKDRNLFLSDAQFMNLRIFVTEFHLLLSDLSPILDEKKLAEFRNIIDNLEKNINKRHYFVKDIYNVSRHLDSIKLTEVFYETLNILSRLKIDLFKEIKNILYIDSTQPF